MARISIFIDGANFYHGMKLINPKYSDFYFDFVKYIKKITKGSVLVDVYYFNAPLKQQFNPITYTKQQLLFERLKKAGYNVILCKRKKRTDSDGNESHQIKEDDIRLALQMQKDAYNNKYDTAYLFSGDGDFAPLPEYLKEKGKKIKIFYFKGSESLSLLRCCDFNCEVLTKRIINQNFSKDAYNEWVKIKENRSL